MNVLPVFYLCYFVPVVPKQLVLWTIVMKMCNEKSDQNNEKKSMYKFWFVKCYDHEYNMDNPHIDKRNTDTIKPFKL